MPLHPTPGKVIVKVDPEEEKTSGGLYIPGTAIGVGNLATVVAANSQAWEDTHGVLRTPIVHKDDRVVIGQYAGVKVTYLNEEYVVLNQHEILAVVEPLPVG